MTRTPRPLILAVSLLLALLGVIVTQTSASAANLLANPGFETGTLSPWTCTGGLGSVVATPVRSGGKALAGAAGNSDIARCGQTLTVRPNSEYTVSAWVRGNYVYLGVTGGRAIWTSSPSAYTQLTIPFTTGAGQTTAEVYLHGWYGQGTYHADDLVFDGPGDPPSPTPTPTVTVSPTATPTTTPTTTPTATVSPTVTPTGSTCALKGKPAGKVLQGYWENWDGASNGVHPPFGWTPITDPRIRQHGYNVINAAFPVIRSDGTVLWEDGMDNTVKVATPEEMCQAKAAGATILMSIGGATAGIDLSSSTVADRFVATVVPILKRYNFDGIDIDIETGLTGSGDINQLSASQANLIRIIDGVLAQMPAGFGLTMAPETAYVTGGSVVYGSIWGAYLPIIKKYADNGRLWWLNMQYYNGSMYGCSGDSYSAGTVQGFVAQTTCLDNGLVIQGTTIRVPYDKQVPGLPAQPGAGGGHMSPSLVSQSWNSFNGNLKGLMTWSINWDGSKSWTFGDNVKALQGR
ncbi:glycosyl hydrolase family 18 protein [Nonomuraea sp. SBT364]|uniref:glycosyl hydrolase family 18 protein n=1 Tax=Nonomuraea sp. SBT364 TaxID=1580530 RepID=UPI00066C19C7|nr:glycosyl hydrolase family 18 protein [Nonomuraea sp. SBT364]